MERFFPDHMSAFRIVHEHPSGVLAAMSFNEWLESLISASPTIALAIGIGLTVAGSGLMAVGSVVMKIGIHQESKRLQRDISVPLSSQLWWLGRVFKIALRSCVLGRKPKNNILKLLV